MVKLRVFSVTSAVGKTRGKLVFLLASTSFFDLVSCGLIWWPEKSIVVGVSPSDSDQNEALSDKWQRMLHNIKDCTRNQNNEFKAYILMRSRRQFKTRLPLAIPMRGL